MSVVTGVMLIVMFGEDYPLQPIQDWLADHCDGAQLVDVADLAGGSKHPQFQAMAAGINHFANVNEFAAFVMSRDWSQPESVILVLQPEEGTTDVYRPADFNL
ncbi:MAG: hypothetical protein V4564_22095 [Pseudomonadota bacterium]